jgi:hypothetical protein
MPKFPEFQGYRLTTLNSPLLSKQLPLDLTPIQTPSSVLRSQLQAQASQLQAFDPSGDYLVYLDCSGLVLVNVATSELSRVYEFHAESGDNLSLQVAYPYVCVSRNRGLLQVFVLDLRPVECRLVFSRELSLAALIDPHHLDRPNRDVPRASDMSGTSNLVDRDSVGGGAGDLERDVHICINDAGDVHASNDAGRGRTSDELGSDRGFVLLAALALAKTCDVESDETTNGPDLAAAPTATPRSERRREDAPEHKESLTVLAYCEFAALAHSHEHPHAHDSLGAEAAPRSRSKSPPKRQSPPRVATVTHVVCALTLGWRHASTSTSESFPAASGEVGREASRMSGAGPPALQLARHEFLCARVAAGPARSVASSRPVPSDWRCALATLPQAAWVERGGRWGLLARVEWAAPPHSSASRGPPLGALGAGPLQAAGALCVTLAEGPGRPPLCVALPRLGPGCCGLVCGAGGPEHALCLQQGDDFVPVLLAAADGAGASRSGLADSPTAGTATWTTPNPSTFACGVVNKATFPDAPPALPQPAPAAGHSPGARLYSQVSPAGGRPRGSRSSLIHRSLRRGGLRPW